VTIGFAAAPSVRHDARSRDQQKALHTTSLHAAGSPTLPVSRAARRSVVHQLECTAIANVKVRLRPVSSVKLTVHVPIVFALRSNSTLGRTPLKSAKRKPRNKRRFDCQDRVQRISLFT
jgi:hypothetical protein